MSELKGFLADDAGSEAEAAPAVDEVIVEPAAEAVQPEPEASATPEPDADEVPEDVRGLRSAVSAVRKERNDYKGQAERLSGELAAIKTQLEALQKAPPPPAPAAPVAVPKAPEPAPDPIEDPAGYARYVARMESVDQAWESRCVITEDLLREKEGDEAVDKAMATFRIMVAANPALGGELRSQRNPARWMFNQVKRAEAAKDIGDDPNAWKEAQKAAWRAEWEAEQAAAAPLPAAAPAAIVLPTSLAGARPAAARTQVVEAPPEFDDIFKRRK